MDAGRVLRQARRRAALTQRRLAEKAGVPQPTVARIERGTTIPRVDTLDKLLEACGEGLYALKRAGIGVDRTQIANLVAVSPGVRARLSEDSEHYEVDRPGAEPHRVAAWQPSKAVRTLVEHDVEFVVIGAFAGRLLGSPIATNDTDICYEHGRENCERMARALADLEASPRRWPADLPFILDGQTISNGCTFTFETVAGDLDILCEPAPGLFYAELRRNAVAMPMDDLHVLVSSLEDLIRMKRSAGRPKDLWAAEILGALQEEIDRAARDHPRD